MGHNNRIWLPIAIVTAALGGPAWAGGYPFSGYFRDSWNQDITIGQAQLGCAIRFFHQQDDGRAQDYHLDFDRFRATGEVRYIVWQRTACNYAAATNLETCTIDFNLESNAARTIVYDHIRSVTENEVQVQFFDQFSDISEYVLSGGKTGGFPVKFFRCPFVPEIFTDLLTAETSKLSLDSFLTSTDLPLQSEMEQTARKVYATLGYTISPGLTFSLAPKPPASQPVEGQTRQGTVQAPQP